MEEDFLGDELEIAEHGEPFEIDLSHEHEPEETEDTEAESPEPSEPDEIPEALQHVLEYKGGEAEDWQLESRGDGYTFDGEHVRDPQGEIWVNEDRALHQEMLAQWREGEASSFMLPDHQETDEEKTTLYVTQLMFDGKGNVSYEIYKHEIYFAKEEPGAESTGIEHVSAEHRLEAWESTVEEHDSQGLQEVAAVREYEAAASFAYPMGEGMPAEHPADTNAHTYENTPNTDRLETLEQPSVKLSSEFEPSIAESEARDPAMPQVQAEASRAPDAWLSAILGDSRLSEDEPAPQTHQAEEGEASPATEMESAADNSRAEPLVQEGPAAQEIPHRGEEPVVNDEFSETQYIVLETPVSENVATSHESAPTIPVEPELAASEIKPAVEKELETAPLAYTEPATIPGIGASEQAPANKSIKFESGANDNEARPEAGTAEYVEGTGPKSEESIDFPTHAEIIFAALDMPLPAPATRSPERLGIRHTGAPSSVVSANQHAQNDTPSNRPRVARGGIVMQIAA